MDQGDLSHVQRLLGLLAWHGRRLGNSDLQDRCLTLQMAMMDTDTDHGEALAALLADLRHYTGQLRQLA